MPDRSANPELLGSSGAKRLKKCGFESIWTVEHVVIPQGFSDRRIRTAKDGKIPGGEDVPIPDPLLPLGSSRPITKKIKLATGVVILPQRHPVYVAKELATSICFRAAG